jgi:hypothetical protein
VASEVELPLVGVDACILIAAVREWDSPPRQSRRHRVGRKHPAVRIMLAATLGLFRLFLVDDVLAEAQRALNTPKDSGSLAALLAACTIVRCPSPSREILEGELRDLHLRMVARLGHLNDAPIAVAMSRSLIKPSLFVSSNSRHWSSGVGSAIGGGVEVMDAVRFADLISDEVG